MDYSKTKVSSAGLALLAKKIRRQLLESLAIVSFYIFMIGELEMPVIPENYGERQNNESKNFDDFLKDPEFKKQKEAAKKELDNSISKWIADHPFTVLTVAFVGTTFISYKLYQRLITTSVYKANIMTLDYIENNIEIIRKTL